MIGAQEVGRYVSAATGLCLNLSIFSPSWLIIQISVFAISTGLSVFNTYSSWTVVLAFQKFGFSNPLLPANLPWKHAWLLFASISTMLTVLSVLHNTLVLLHSVYQFCKKHHCMNCDRLKQPSSTSITLNNLNLTESLIDDDGKDQEKQETGDVVSDPCRPCYRCGCNVVTRNETLGSIALWFQDIPMLTLSVLYAYTQLTCANSASRNISPVLRSVGINVTAATATALWRAVRSFLRLYSSVVVRIKTKTADCITKCQKYLPPKGDVAYPPDTCVQPCIFGY